MSAVGSNNSARAGGPHNLARLAEEAFERRGDYTSLLFEGRWHRSAELFERAQRLAGGLAEFGVAAGDRVVVTMANSPEVGIVYNALWRLGAVVTPATFLLSPAELRHVIADAEARLVLTAGELEQAQPLPIARRADHELAALLYTGGTTGRAKGVMLSHSNLYFAGRA